MLTCVYKYLHNGAAIKMPGSSLCGNNPVFKHYRQIWTYSVIIVSIQQHQKTITDFGRSDVHIKVRQKEPETSCLGLG